MKKTLSISVAVLAIFTVVALGAAAIACGERTAQSAHAQYSFAQGCTTCPYGSDLGASYCPYLKRIVREGDTYCRRKSGTDAATVGCYGISSDHGHQFELHPVTADFVLVTPESPARFMNSAASCLGDTVELSTLKSGIHK